MVTTSGLGYRLTRDRDTLARIDFTLSPGSFLAVVEENGAGKTALLDLLMGFRSGGSWVLFPLSFVLAALWARWNARRWCVTL